MPRYRDSDYTIYPRKFKDKTVWYYYAYVDGVRQPGKSTSIGYTRERDRAKTRKQAEGKVRELLEYGKGLSGPTLRQWVEQRNFWDWHRSDYIRGILARSPKDKPGITQSYCRDAQRVTESKILPYHGDKQIDRITAMDCEDLLFEWQATGRANKTVNNWKSVYSTILGEYERVQLMKDARSLYRNPWRQVRPLAVEKNKRGGLSLDEARRLLEVPVDDKYSAVYYPAMKLAFMTGLRISEVCGIVSGDVKDVEVKRGDRVLTMSYLEIDQQYNQKMKRRTLVKDKEVRQIPITPGMRKELQPFMGKKDQYLFSFHPRREIPITANRLRDWFYKRLESVGIGEEERKKRNIVFHSTRRFFNTLLRRAHVDDTIIRRFTGHDSEAMTEHYTDYIVQDLPLIEQAQRKFLEGKIKE
ncbi:hypothetical protein B4O97_03370 [Marispirochaeta aestuarii]|uniref:Tyr recombinase domain-containing protein n=1 Tax=Marispirochaeta aestuarii TaxID=1963862 RepID=A0A1Y1S161_9SPIO|nr:site-specific integrase [Marispirochaeta aestuarii]ORC37242.1 hypothetical protein B4O97_03370 [Marispirochaeta aestuarii]